ncbi:MAG TPA: hypothetical protein VGE38_01785 [Nocardioides sp.]|uniref:hypothetical protein n=1 Tax=Nocardioides sp. TaxID=35761 RepID=UPI002ED7B69A
MSTYSTDLLDRAPETFRTRYEARMADRLARWAEAWSGLDWHHPHPEDGLVDAHCAAWHEAREAARRSDPTWEPSLLDEALLEVLLLGATMPRWEEHLLWGDLHVALYRQSSHARRAGDAASPTPLGVLLHHSLRIGLPKTIDRVVKRAQEAAESLGERISGA